MNRPASHAAIAQLQARIGHHLQHGQLAQAQQALEALVEQAPEDLNARLWLSKVRMDRGQVQAAIAMLKETAPRLPADSMMVGEAAKQMLMAGETALAHDCLTRHDPGRTNAPGALSLLAWVWNNLGHPEKALPLHERAMAAGLDGPHPAHLHGTLLQFVGRIDDAERVLDSCLARWPDFGEAALTRSRLRRQGVQGNHVEWLRKQVDLTPAGSENRAHFHFALFKELDDMARHDEAWPELARANAIMHDLYPYDADADRQLIDATIARCDSSFCQAPPDGVDTSGPVPIFIIGMPRSGTTLLERMLSNHSQVATAGEIPDFQNQWHHANTVRGESMQDILQAIRHADRIDAGALGTSYMRQVAWRAPDQRFLVDKMPNNFPFAGFIARALPRARILMIRREPMAVCFSNYKAMFGGLSAHCYELADLGRYYVQHARLQQQWKNVLGDSLLEIDYAELVSDPATTMTAVLEHCGLAMEPACLQPTGNATPVSTPSSAQVREGIHTRGLDDWQHYADRLQPLRDVLTAHGMPADPM